MDYQKIMVVIVLLGLTACATVQQLAWDVQKSLRKPGEKSLALPQKIWEEYDCANLSLPFIKIETNELIPPRLQPGKEFNHRLIYVMCSNERADEILGTLSTRIYFRNQRIVDNRSQNYAIRPGRWRIDTFIELPPDAITGVYALEVQFSSRKLKFQETHSFVVESGAGGSVVSQIRVYRRFEACEPRLTG